MNYAIRSVRSSSGGASFPVPRERDNKELELLLLAWGRRGEAMRYISFNEKKDLSDVLRKTVKISD